jgi:serine/threonine-protein kinase
MSPRTRRCANDSSAARAVASLNHPHICTLHNIGSQDGVAFLVMEYLDGETLAERLTKAQGSGLKGQGLPLDQALRYAIEIADALDKAHRAGIVHRDLKPGNIMLTKSGTKLLDFGLAKTAASVVAGSGLSLPTTPTNLTAQGTILGTLQYMAPEQLEGAEADARTDIFAFGAVLFEMLTGKKAFEGKSQTSLLGAILKETPAPVSALQPRVPTSLNRIVGTCLAKDPDDRWQSFGDLQRELRWIADALIAASGIADGFKGRWRTAMVGATWTLSAALIAVAAWMLKPGSNPRRALTRFEVALPPGTGFSNTGRHVIAVSPDGSRLAFVANRQIYVRSMDQPAATAIRGSDVTPIGPFFSPDGQWIAFWSGGGLKKIAVSGGVPVTVADTATGNYGASWSGDWILFGAGSSGIYRVPAAGGVPEQVIAVDAGREASSPQLLPDGKTVLFTVRTPAPGLGWNDASLVTQSMAGGEAKIVVEGARDGRYLSTGHLVYGRDETLFAVPFDPGTFATSGGAVSLVEEVTAAGSTASMNMDISATGTLVYVPAGAGQGRTVVWVDRQGRETPIPAPPRAYVHPRLSPDGTRLALADQGDDRDIWLWDLSRGALERLTVGSDAATYPVWAPDGNGLFFTGGGGVSYQKTDGTGSATLLNAGGGQPTSISPDGARLLITGNGGSDVLQIRVDGTADRTVLLQTPFIERNGEISPDGRWLAYEANDSGVFEIYVRPFPDVEGRRRQVSTGGGIQPLWSRSGDELFFTAPTGELMRVDVSRGAAWDATIPTKLIDANYFTGASSYYGRMYDVDEGGRLLMIREGSGNGSSAAIMVVLNWVEELKQRVPTR